MGQPLDLLDQPGVGGGERGVEIEHAGERAGAVDHRHVAQPAPPHEADRLVERLVERDGRDRPAHQQRDRLLEHRPAGDPARDVLLGDDADEALRRVQHDRRRRPGRAHPADDLGDRAALRHDHRRRRHVIARPASDRPRSGNAPRSRPAACASAQSRSSPPLRTPGEQDAAHHQRAAEPMVGRRAARRGRRPRAARRTPASAAASRPPVRRPPRAPRGSRRHRRAPRGTARRRRGSRGSRP